MTNAVNEQEERDPLYVERASRFLIGKRCSPRVLKIIQWASRLGYMVCIYAMIVFVAYPGDSAGIYGIIAAFLIVLGLILLIYQTEFLDARTLRGISPVKLYKDGVYLKSYPFGFFVGKGGFIPASQIDHIRVLRQRAEQITAPKEGIVWKNATTEMIIHRKNGKRDYSGIKIPTEVTKMIGLMRDMWDISVIDDGEGAGIAEYYKDGVRVSVNDR